MAESPPHLLEAAPQITSPHRPSFILCYGQGQGLLLPFALGVGRGSVPHGREGAAFECGRVGLRVCSTQYGLGGWVCTGVGGGRRLVRRLS